MIAAAILIGLINGCGAELPLTSDSMIVQSHTNESPEDNPEGSQVDSDEEIIKHNAEMSEAKSNILQSESNIGESSSAHQTIEHFPNLRLVASEGDWNTWSATVRVKKQVESKDFQQSSEFFQLQFSLPVTWEPDVSPQTVQQRNDDIFGYQFVMEMGEQKITKFRIFDIYLKDYKYWNSTDNKLDAIEYVLPPYEPSQDGKGPDNHISVSRETVGNREWLLYCAFYIDYMMPPNDEEMHYCNLYTVYEDAYEIGFFMDIRDKTVDDSETKELLLMILKNVKIVPLD